MTSIQAAQPSGYAQQPEPARTVARMAAAKRGRNNRLVLGSALVVAVGGLIGGLAGVRAGAHNQVLAVARAVPIGTTVTADDLVAARVTADANVMPVPVSAESSVVGKVARVDLAPGELLTAAMVGTSDGFTAGQALVALPLKSGQLPARGLQAGEHVMILGTPGANGLGASGSTALGAAGQSPSSPSSAAAGSSLPGGTPAAGAGVSATVAEVGPFNQTAQTTTVDVRVPAGAAAMVADLASTGDVAVVLLPAGTP